MIRTKKDPNECLEYELSEFTDIFATRFHNEGMNNILLAGCPNFFEDRYQSKH